MSPSGPGDAGAIQGGTAGCRVRIAISRPCPGTGFFVALQARFVGGEGGHTEVLLIRFDWVCRGAEPRRLP